LPTQQNSLENVTRSSNTQQTTGTTPSLLDKLLQEANTQIQNESTKNTTPIANIDVSEDEVVKTTQIKEVENKVITTSQEQQSVQVKEVITKELTLNSEKTTTIQTQVVKENVSVTPKDVNEKVANELAKISQTKPEKLNLSKEEVVALKKKLLNRYWIDCLMKTKPNWLKKMESMPKQHWIQAVGNCLLRHY
jgi:hypothetical protein